MYETFRRPSLIILALSTTVTWIVGLLAPDAWALYAIGACWLTFGSYVWYRLIRNGHHVLAAIPVFFVVVIGIGVSLPRDVLDALLQPANEFLHSINSPLKAGKLGHVFCFAMLTLFALFVRRRLEVRAMELILFIVLLALATEGIQLFVAGRTTNLTDLGFDLLGAFIGFAGFWIYKATWSKSESESEPE